MIGLLCAVPFECAAIKRLMKNRRADGRVTMGKLDKTPVGLIESGIGIANAAIAAAVLAERLKPRLIVNFGIGGAYPGSGLSIGDIAIAERETYADSGVLLNEGLKGFEKMGLELIKKGSNSFYNELPVTTPLAKKSAKILRDMGARSGPFLTVSMATGTLNRAVVFERRYGAICESMEGAAVVQTGIIYNIPVLEIRGISNIVEDRDLKKWDKDTAAKNVQEAVLRIIGGL